MTPETYKQELEKLRLDFEEKKRNLARDYCISNNPYKVGDVITDHIGSIRIEIIKVGYGSLSGNPCCVYRGLELKKDGFPTKKMSYRDVWQSNIVEK